MAPRRPQGAPRQPQDGTKNGPRRPKTPQDDHKTAQDRPRRPQDDPKTTQDASKTLQDGPRCLRRRKMIPNAMKKAPQQPKTPPKTAPKTPLGILNSDLRGAAVLPALRAQSARPVVFSDRPEGVWDLLQNFFQNLNPPLHPPTRPRAFRRGDVIHPLNRARIVPRRGPRRGQNLNDFRSRLGADFSLNLGPQILRNRSGFQSKNAFKTKSRNVDF